MKYLVLDDEKIGADYLVSLIKKADKDAETVSFQNPIKALELAKGEHFDVFFLDIQIPGISGVDFAKQIKSVNPKANFIFVTGYSDYMGDAFRLDASDYLMKPVKLEQVVHALENLRYRNNETVADSNEKNIQIRCFGNFDILINGRPVRFGLEKTRELLAYLVHRKGARCTAGEIISVLWEDGGHESYYRMLKKDLQDTLEPLGCADIIFSSRGQLGLTDLDRIDCDYFRWTNGEADAINLYQGEYMAQYTWAEEVNALLESEKYGETSAE